MCIRDRDYIALIPLDDSDDVYIYGYNEVGDDEFELVDICLLYTSRCV